MTDDALKKRFEDACKALDGTMKRQGIEDVCEVRPHETALIKVIMHKNDLLEISAENELASTVIRYVQGRPVVKITVNKDKKYVLFTMLGGDTCSLERQPKIIRGSCFFDGRTVDFSFDP